MEGAGRTRACAPGRHNVPTGRARPPGLVEPRRAEAMRCAREEGRPARALSPQATPPPRATPRSCDADPPPRGGSSRCQAATDSQADAPSR